MLSQASRDTIVDALLESRNNVRMRYNKLINPDAKLAAIDQALAELQQPAEYMPMPGYIVFRLANGELKIIAAHTLDGLPFPDDVVVCKRGTVQQQGRGWEPLADGEYSALNPKDKIQVEEHWLTVIELVVEGRPEVEATIIELPPDIRLCRRVSMTALDAPDGAGDWWFEGYDLDDDEYNVDNPESKRYIFRTWIEVVMYEGELCTKLKIDHDEYAYRSVTDLVGTWWRAHTPWGRG